MPIQSSKSVIPARCAPPVFYSSIAVHISADTRCHPGDSRGLPLPAAPTCGRLSPWQRRRLPCQSCRPLEPRHRYRESSQNGRGGKIRPRGRWQARGANEWVAKQAGRSEAEIVNQTKIKMESDREGKRAWSCSAAAARYLCAGLTQIQTLITIKLHLLLKWIQFIIWLTDCTPQ